MPVSLNDRSMKCKLPFIGKYSVNLELLDKCFCLWFSKEIGIDKIKQFKYLNIFTIPTFNNFAKYLPHFFFFKKKNVFFQKKKKWFRGNFFPENLCRPIHSLMGLAFGHKQITINVSPETFRRKLQTTEW